MPSKSTEALERKAARRKERREAANPPRPIVRQPHHGKGHPAYRNQLPRQPEMSKAELRGMLEAAMAETARQCQ